MVIGARDVDMDGRERTRASLRTRRVPCIGNAVYAGGYAGGQRIRHTPVDLHDVALGLELLDGVGRVAASRGGRHSGAGQSHCCGGERRCSCNNEADLIVVLLGDVVTKSLASDTESLTTRNVDLLITH